MPQCLLLAPGARSRLWRGADPPQPAPLRGAQLLQQHVRQQMRDVQLGAQTPAGKEWVRGWDDWKQAGPTPGPAVAAVEAAEAAAREGKS